MLRQYRMKLNPAKYAIGVESGKFLGFMVNHRGIEVNPAKARAVIDLKSTRMTKEVQKFAGMIAALSRFISRSTDRCNPFFKALKERGKVNWNDECEEALLRLKKYLASPLMLSKLLLGKTLYVYLAISDKAMSLVHVREEEKVQLPVYYSNNTSQRAEERYSSLKKFALLLIMAARNSCLTDRPTERDQLPAHCRGTGQPKD